MKVKMEYFDFAGFQESDSENDLKIMSMFHCLSKQNEINLSMIKSIHSSRNLTVLRHLSLMTLLNQGLRGSL